MGMTVTTGIMAVTIPAAAAATIGIDRMQLDGSA
jgi:hypothetical protein